MKTFGNIICFRGLKEATDQAIALFGNKDAGGIVLLRTYDDYYYGYDEKGVYKPGYEDLITHLTGEFPLGKPLVGEEKQRIYPAVWCNP